MHKRILSLLVGFLFVSVLLSSAPSLFADETITITTYYPSPYGSYQDLYVANKLGIGTTSPTEKLEVNGKINAGLASSNNVQLDINAINAYNNGAVSTLYMQYTGGNTNFGNGKVVIYDNGSVERVCPTGFTNVKAGNNQLGCIETAPHATSATWFTAVSTCFTTYGGKLPDYSEWYIAWTNYTLTTPGTYFEWLSNSDYYSQAACAMAPSWALTSPTTNPCNGTMGYRCWIPR